MYILDFGKVIYFYFYFLITVDVQHYVGLRSTAEWLHTVRLTGRAPCWVWYPPDTASPRLYVASRDDVLTASSYSIPSPLTQSLDSPPIGQPARCSLELWDCFRFVCVDFVPQSPHRSEVMWYVSFSVWLISLGIMPARSIRVVANGRISSSF